MNPNLETLLQDPDYRHLVRLRRRVAVLLSLVMLVTYLAFILAIAFKPALLGMPLHAGSPITLGLPLGVGLIVLAVAITGIYVRLSNTVFDPLTARLRARHAQG